MSFSCDRRQFLARSGQIAAALTVGSLAAPRLLSAAEPAWPVGCRDAMLRSTGLADCWSAMREVGAECLEVDIVDDLSLPSLFHPEKKYSAATAEGIQQVAADIQAAGGRVTALCMHNRFDERPDFEIEWCTKVAQAARALGAKAVRIDVVARKLTAPELLEFIVPVLKKLLAATESTGVALAIENHGRTTNDPDFLRPLFERVGSDRLGLTLDTGNFYWFGHPLSKLYDLYQMFAPRAFHTHCKSINYPADQRDRQREMGWEYGKYNCPIDQGDIDFRRVVAILKQAGYANDLCIENESLGRFPQEDRAAVLAREIKLLKSLR